LTLSLSQSATDASAAKADQTANLKHLPNQPNTQEVYVDSLTYDGNKSSATNTLGVTGGQNQAAGAGALDQSQGLTLDGAQTVWTKGAPGRALSQTVSELDLNQKNLQVVGASASQQSDVKNTQLAEVNTTIPTAGVGSSGTVTNLFNAGTVQVQSVH
jgi:hypothetical protein